jgi:hypothetical protein
MQGGVERALVYVEDAVRDLLDALADPPPVHRREGKRFENQKVERASEGVGLRARGHDNSVEGSSLAV